MKNRIVRLLPLVALLLASSIAGRAGTEMVSPPQNQISQAQNAPGYWVPPAEPAPPQTAYYYPAPPAYYAPPPPSYYGGYYGPGPSFAFYGPGLFFGFHGRR